MPDQSQHRRNRRHKEHFPVLIEVLAGIIYRIMEMECPLGDGSVESRPGLGLPTSIATIAAMETDEGSGKERGWLRLALCMTPVTEYVCQQHKAA